MILSLFSHESLVLTVEDHHHPLTQPMSVPIADVVHHSQYYSYYAEVSLGLLYNIHHQASSCQH